MPGALRTIFTASGCGRAAQLSGGQRTGRDGGDPAVYRSDLFLFRSDGINYLDLVADEGILFAERLKEARRRNRREEK